MADQTDQQPTADVTAQRVARVYAEALLNAAEKAGQADTVLDEMRELVLDTFKAYPQLEVVLSSAALGRTLRHQFIRNVFQGRSSDIFYHFLQVLNDHDRLELLRAVAMALRDLNDQRSGRRRVYVTSAVPLPEETRNRLLAELVSAMRLTPVLEEHVDPEVLGGMRLRVGDLQVDATARTALETIRSEILARSSHEIQSRRDSFSTAA